MRRKTRAIRLRIPTFVTSSQNRDGASFKRKSETMWILHMKTRSLLYPKNYFLIYKKREIFKIANMNCYNVIEGCATARKLFKGETSHETH